MKTDISHITIPEEFHKYTDFYIPEDSPIEGICFPDAEPLALKSDFTDIILFMLDMAKEKDKLEFSLDLSHEDNRVLFRGHSINSMEGRVFIFRRLPNFIPDIHHIGMSEHVVELLLHEKLNAGGLVIIAGETGQGKSTTAGSAIAHRLKHYGSFCLTIEDPVELPLQGFYNVNEKPGKRGVCFQTSVDQEKIAEAIKSALRCYPSVSSSILFLGEIRDADMAYEVLKIAANGHLVITTMHGSDILTSLKRFINLCTSASTISDIEIRSMLGSVLRLVIHQKLEVVPNGKKKLRQTVLFSSTSTCVVANRIKGGGNSTIDTLSTDIQHQNMMINKGISIANSN